MTETNAASPDRLGAPGMAERVLRGVAAMGLIIVVGLVGQFVVVPIGMYAWGPVRYGEWTSLSAIIAFLSLTDLGVQSHVVNRMCAHHARGDHERFLDDLHSALRLQGPLALGIWAIGALVSATLPLQTWFGITTATRLETYLTLALLGLDLLVGVPLGAIRGTYRASGQLVRAAHLTAIKRAVEILLPVLLMLAGASFPVIAAGRLAATLAFDAFVWHDLSRRNPWFRLIPLGGDRAVGLAMLAPGALFLAAAVGELLANQGNLLVVQSFVGGEEVSRFATHRNIANMGRLLSVQLTTVIWPELTALDALADAARLVRAHRTTAKLCGFVTGLALFGFVPLAEPIYSAWTLRKLSLDLPTFGMLALQTTLWGFWGVASTALLATNRQGRLAAILAANAALVFGLSILLVPRYGIRGASAAALLADLCLATWFVPRTACRALGDAFGGYAREILGTLGIALLLPAVLAALAYVFLPAGLVRGFVTSALFALLALPLFWATLTSEERGVARGIVFKISQRVGGPRTGAA